MALIVTKQITKTTPRDPYSTMTEHTGPKRTPPLTEEELIAVTVGERRQLNDTIYLAPYDPAWPAIYAAKAQRIRDALGSAVLRLEHTGSTAVPGLAAKPIIDMVLAVADSADEAAYVPALAAIGYTLHVREPAWYEHRLLKSPGFAGNLHLFSLGCTEMDQMLLFRDWLRTHQEDRILYENTKRELAARIWKYTQNYADAKSDVVQAILAHARLCKE